MTTITIKEYVAERSGPFSNKDAIIIGPVLVELAKQGGVTSRDVLDAARSSNSPLHPYFQWDNHVAADLYRLEQARSMLKSIRIRYTEDQLTEVKEARALTVIQRAAYDREPRRYHSFEVLHGDSAFAAQMMDSAFEDLSSWRRKYEPYVQTWERFGDCFRAVLNQIDEFSDEFKSAGVASEMDRALVPLIRWREEFQAGLETWTAFREQVGFVMEAIVEAEEVFTKARGKMDRDCLKCGTTFKSFHAGHRICNRCFNSFDKNASGMVEQMALRKKYDGEE